MHLFNSCHCTIIANKYCMQWSTSHADLGIPPKFGSELLHLTRRCRGIDRYIAASIELSVDEVHCLGALFFDRPNSVKDLSELISVGSTRASKILKDLELRGYVTRVMDSADRRKEHVFLTEAGERTVRHIASLYAEYGTEVVAHWCSGLSDEFSSLLKTIAEAK